jgi:hypothetical protein
MTTLLDNNAMLSPQVEQNELAQDFSSDVLPMNQFTILDPSELLRRIDVAMPGNGIWNKWTELDNGHPNALTQRSINAAPAQQ